jgi:hypothetical protein
MYLCRQVSSLRVPKVKREILFLAPNAAPERVALLLRLRGARRSKSEPGDWLF